MAGDFLALPELTFDEKQHRYLLHGVEIPSVTTLMAPLSQWHYKGIDGTVLAHAAERGTAVHNAIENFVKFGVVDIAARHGGYFAAFKQWMQDKGAEPYGSEVRLYHKYLAYAGTADMLAIINGQRVLIDFKTTSSVSPMLCGVQLEAYEKAFASHVGDDNIQNKQIVHLKKDGSYEVYNFPINDMVCWNVFNSLLMIRNYTEHENCWTYEKE